MHFISPLFALAAGLSTATRASSSAARLAIPAPRAQQAAYQTPPRHSDGSIPFFDSFASHRQQTIRRVLQPAYASLAAPFASGGLRIFSPVDYGCDPDGVQDSAKCLQATIQAMLSSAVNQTNDDTFLDLGGAVLEMSGAVFAVSGPVVLPPGIKNFKVRGGQLRALPSFAPTGGDLLRIGANDVPKGHACLNVDIEGVTLDGGGLAGVALSVLNGQYVNVGPANLIYGFTSIGVNMNGTGGGYIHHSWMGQFPPSGDTSSDSPLPTPTATNILLANSEHDCYVEDVIIYSGLVGVDSTNGANQIQGVHTWNDATSHGGIGIILRSGMGKVIDSYLDFCPLVIVAPKSVLVSNNLFLAAANMILRGAASVAGGGSTRGDGALADTSSRVENMVVSSNRFWSENKYRNSTIVLQGQFDQVLGTVVEGNSADALWDVKSTRATKTVEIPTNQTTISLDFGADLLFPSVAIQEVFCSISAYEAIGHVVEPLAGGAQHSWQPAGVVRVILSKGLVKPGGSITCKVDQSTRTHDGH